jgi:V8-like Glu-specific endopeptidase
MKSQSPMLHRSSLALSACATLLAVALPLTASSAPPLKRPLPSIGEQRAFDLRIGPASLGKTFAVRADDAGFVKVHFDHFSLPDGVTLEVSNPAGTEVYRYTNKSQKGQTSFSAMSIHGPVALLRLVGTPTRAWRTTDGVRVGRYLRGHSERHMREVMRSVDGRAIQGAKDSRPVACYNSTDPTAVDRSRPVGFLVKNDGYVCTAWRAGPDNRLFTNNHCFDTDERVKIAEVWFDYQAQDCANTTYRTPVKVFGDQMLATNEPLDYTLFTVKNFETISQFGYLGLETRAPQLNEEIFISGHPAGRRKELSVVSDKDGGGRCRINQVGSGSGTLYYCDTEGGNSGSPVIARSSNKAIALHNLGGSLNSGVKMSLIWPQVSSYFGGVAPNGDTGTTPPPPPPPPADTVVHNVTLPSVSRGSWSSTYTVAIPAGTTKLVVNISGGTGDADLYVYRDTAPTSSVSSAVNTPTRCVPYKSGNTETCTFTNPTAGTTYYIRARAWSTFSGVNMKATRSP